MLTESQFERLGHKKPDELKVTEKEELALFFSLPGTEVEGRPAPVIPGSSLRGMIRALVEIAGYGRIRWVAKEPAFTFRAVAASRNDPLSDRYRDVIGTPYRTNVRAGYLEQRGDDWWVRPALTPQVMGWPGNAPYLTVKEKQIRTKDIPGYFHLNSENYRLQVHRISFDVRFGTVRGGRTVLISEIGSREAGYKYEGVMVCSGNMMEAGKKGQESPRRNHTIVLAPDKNAASLKIKSQSIEDYLAGLTAFQQEKLSDWGGPSGCLRDGAPIFYVTEGNEVAYFGHCPNFRIPALLMGADRAATPHDFIPQPQRTDPRPDLADAIFGWAEEPDAPVEGQRAGRIFFSDARYMAAKEGVWLKPYPTAITLHTLAGPKPTTFQHYLVQDAGAGHDPDVKKSLAYYGSDPEKTQIRGFKLYWHKGSGPDIEATFKEREHENQLTRIIPIKPGVRFSFKIHFENLREEELGALWWALTLPGEDGRIYRHKVGMGKPLGMGAVAITPKLHLSNRRERYSRLFDGEAWHKPSSLADGTPYLKAFERYVLKESRIAPDRNHLAEVERIQMLLALLEWREGDPDWVEETRYMEIEYGPDKVNEYKERPVLPDPLIVAGKHPIAKRGIQPGFPKDSRAAKMLDSRERVKTGDEVVNRPSARLNGEVAHFNHQRGYGFIRQKDKTNIFFHCSTISGFNLSSFNKGQSVTYLIRRGMKGPEAVDIQVEQGPA
jgi:CRISPR-associated protein (TIGR03986 family)